MNRRVLVTGSRDWTDWETIFAALDRELASTEGLMTLVHGAARGADSLAAEWGRLMEKWLYAVKVEPHEAEWERYGNSAGHIRNKKMVDLGEDVCLAFQLGVSRGTRDCMAAAKAAGIPVIDHNPPWGSLYEKD